MTRSKQEQEEAREFLRAKIAPGDTLYTSVKHVSRSGMQRTISVYRVDGDEIWDVSGFVARAIGARFDDKRGGVVVGGCGMDMGFHVVYTLSHALWPKGFGCVGERCPSNDHSNGDRDYTPHGAIVGCAGEPCTCHDETAWDYEGAYPHGCSSCGCHRGEHWHSDGGYALSRRWL